MSAATRIQPPNHLLDTIGNGHMPVPLTIDPKSFINSLDQLYAQVCLCVCVIYAYMYRYCVLHFRLLFTRYVSSTCVSTRIITQASLGICLSIPNLTH